MGTAFDNLMTAVLALPEEQREMLLSKVEESLTATEARNEKLWAEVAAKRAEEWDSGAIEGIPWKQVKAEAARLMEE